MCQIWRGRGMQITSRSVKAVKIAFKPVSYVLQLFQFRQFCIPDHRSQFSQPFCGICHLRTFCALVRIASANRMAAATAW